MTNYAYLRVSTDTQKTDSQRAAVLEFCKRKGLKRITMIDEVASGAKSWKSRKIAGIVNALKPGDSLVTTEVSRLGRTMLDIITVAKRVAEADATLYLMREGLVLGKDGGIGEQVMIQVFGMVAELERSLIRDRVKTGLANARKRGVKLGRQHGQQQRLKLEDEREKIIMLFNLGVNDAVIGRTVGATGPTVKRWRVRHEITKRRPT